MAVRREAVLLEVEDHFTRGMLQAAAAAETLDRSLGSLSGSAVTSSRSTDKHTKSVRELSLAEAIAEEKANRLRKALREQARAAVDAELGVSSLKDTTVKTGNDIDRLSGRVAILARVAATLGPGLVPIGAVGVAGVAGLASQLGFATIGALSLVAAVQGVGDAIKAVEKARLEPTVANLQAAEEAMARLAPEAQAFVTRFQELRPVLGSLRDAAAKGWFPGLVDALDSLESAAPKVERILLAVSTAGGDLIARGAESLAGDRWSEFFDFIEAEAPDAITALGQAVGSLTHGLAGLWTAMDPVNDAVRDWMVDAAKSFDRWASSIDEGDVEGFLDYVSETGPKVAAAAGAIANAILQIAEAAGPLGGPVLDSITAVANAISVIADSPLGTPIMTAVTALSALSLVSRGLNGALGGVDKQLAAIGAQGPRTASALQMVYRAGITLAGLEIGTQVINGLRGAAVGAAPDVDKLSAALARADSTALSETLGGSLADLADAADRGSLDKLAIGAGNLADKGGIVGDVFKAFAPSITHAADEAKKFDNAAASLDASLAGLVATAGPEVAQARFRQLAEAENLSADAQQNILDVLPQYRAALDAAGAAAESTAGGTDTLTTSQRRARSALIAARDAARESGKAFLDFSDSIAGDKFSMSGWIDSFEAQVKALTEFRDNLQTLRERDLDPSVVTELEKQGPAAAQAVAGLAKGGAENIERLNRAARTAGKEIRGMGKDAKDAEKNVQDLGNKNAKPKVGLDAKGFDNKRAAVDADLNRTGGKTAKPKADLNDKPFKNGMKSLKSELTGATRLGAKPKVSLSGVPGVESQLANLTRPRTVTIATRIAGSAIGRLQGFFADGGYTGDGGKYEPAGIVHRGEVVLPREIVKRDWPMLSSRYGHLPGFAGGGVVGDPQWKPATTATSYRNRGPSWLPAGMEQLHFELPKSLKGLNRALKASETALDNEKKARDAVVEKMNSLRDAVAGKITSDLFGETDVWTRGGSIADGNARLDADIARGNRLNANIAALKSKGLTGPALDALLANADDETIANYAAGTRAELAGYRSRYEQRAAVASTAGNAAASAAYGKELAATTRELREANAELKAIKAAIKREHKEDRQAQKKGAGDSARNRRRGGS